MTDEESNLKKAENYYKKYEAHTDTFLQRLIATPITFVVVTVIVCLALIGAFWAVW